MSSQPTSVTTEISVDGANCSLCFSETVGALKAQPGVEEVQGSIEGQCFRVDHVGVEADQLIAVVHQHLHGVDVASSELVMVAVDAETAQLGCTHGQPASSSNLGEGSDV